MRGGPPPKYGDQMLIRTLQNYGGATTAVLDPYRPNYGKRKTETDQKAYWESYA